MSEPLILVRDEGPVRWLTLNRPDKRNALSGELVFELLAALDEARDAARCVAITGAGSCFSAGADLAALQRMQTATKEENLADSLALAGLFRVIAEYPLPIIAAVNGHALGGGAGLAVACDFTVAADTATLGFTEVRIGFVPAIVLNFLIRVTGERAARELCLTGRRVSADEAAAMGLVNRVVASDALPGAVAAIGDELHAASPEAIATTKRLFLDLRPMSLADGLRHGAEKNATARGSDDCREGIAAFLEKRKPRWSDS